MSLWLSGWAGDNAGKIVGRTCNRLLLSYTQATWGLPGALFTAVWQYTKVGHPPVSVFPEARVHCLTPGARTALACNVETIALNPHLNENYLAVDVAELDDGTGKAAWRPGVHLFLVALSLMPHQPNSSGTIATAIIDRHVPRVNGTWKLSLGAIVPPTSQRRIARAPNRSIRQRSKLSRPASKR